MISEKESQIEDLTNLGVSILSHFYSMETEGKLTRSQAQRQAMSLIRDLRFGPEGRDYYWINDKTPTLLVHPFRPDLERADLSSESTGEFLSLFETFVTIAEEQQEGFTRYQWQYYGEADQVASKISYIKYFEPWEWIIGTGLYIDDVEKAAQSQRNINVIFVITVIQLLLAAFVVYKILMRRKQAPSNQ